MWTSSNAPVPGLTPLTTPNGSSIALRTFAQQRHKVPIGYNGTPTSTSKNAPFRLGQSPLQLPASSFETQTTHHPKRNPDPISRFSTMHRTDRPTGRLTAGTRYKPVPIGAYALYDDHATRLIGLMRIGETRRK